MIKFHGRNLKRYQSYITKAKVKNMTVKEGIARHGDKAIEAVVGECKPLLDQESFQKSCRYQEAHQRRAEKNYPV